MKKVRLKKNDEVLVIAGKDRDKTGRILKIFPARERVIVEGVNRVKRHRKPTQKDQHGGIKDEERPLHVSNVMMLCPSCKKKTRLGLKTLGAKERARFCKRCEAVVDK
jgi:large subunit ribosomal protein L24